MARHEQEDSRTLEEQLAWLDAIKRMAIEEHAVESRAASSSPESPYPANPWEAVADGRPPIPPPTFRALADDDRGPPRSTIVAPPEPAAAGDPGVTAPSEMSSAIRESEAYGSPDPLEPLPAAHVAPKDDQSYTLPEEIYARPHVPQEEVPAPPAPRPSRTAPPRPERFRGPPVRDYGEPPPDTLPPDALRRRRKAAPAHGWRRAVYRASGGLVRLAPSPAEQRRQAMIDRICTPVAHGHHRVAVLSLKGGVGKTTTTVGLGSTLASSRGDRVIAVDANPDRGTLSDKVRLDTAATVRDLVYERERIQRYADVRAFTSQAPSRLEVLASDRDPAVSEAFSEEDYLAIARVLESFYSICITDCGTGLMHSAMSGVLGVADQLVLVSSPSVDGARSASATLDWLEAHDCGDLVESASVVLSIVRTKSKSTVDLDRLQAHFEARCRSVVRIPFDPHLEEGAEIDLDELEPPTREAYFELAAAVAEGFTR